MLQLSWLWKRLIWLSCVHDWCHVVKQGCEGVSVFCRILLVSIPCLRFVCMSISEVNVSERAVQHGDINQGFPQVLVPLRVEFQPAGRSRYNLTFRWLPASAHSRKKAHALSVHFKHVVFVLTTHLSLFSPTTICREIWLCTQVAENEYSIAYRCLWLYKEQFTV